MAQENFNHALMYFNIPRDKEEILFLLPGFYVGAADGNLDAVEMLGVIVTAAVATQIDVFTPEFDKTKISEILSEKTISIVRKCDLKDIDILMKGIQAKIETMTGEKAVLIKNLIRTVIVLVANISGPRKYIFWGTRVDQNESEMIQRIASYL